MLQYHTLDRLCWKKFKDSTSQGTDISKGAAFLSNPNTYLLQAADTRVYLLSHWISTKAFLWKAKHKACQKDGTERKLSSLKFLGRSLCMFLIEQQPFRSFENTEANLFAVIQV